MTKYLLLVFVSIALLVSCSKDDEIKDQDYLIFGHFYGQCYGEECVETFKLVNSNVYEDTIDDYSANTLKFIKLEDVDYNDFSELIDSIPTQLLNDTVQVFGCPDCADGGGMYIKYSKDGIVKEWRIDQMKYNVPSYLHNYMDKVNEKIEILNI